MTTKFSFEGLGSLFSLRAKGGWSILVPVSLVLGLISDLMQPLAPFSSYLFLVSALAALLLVITIFAKETVNISLIWGCILAVATAVISGGITLLQTNSPGTRGVIVESIPALKQLQVSAGLMRDDLVEIKESGQRTMEGVEQIAESNSEIVLTLTDIRAGIRSLSQSGGIIVEATNLAQHYHNARIYSQRGEVDLALESYKKVFESKLQFVDPLLDVVTLTIQLYGIDGARSYLDKNLKPILNSDLYWLARQKLAEKPIPELVNRLILNVPEVVSGGSKDGVITYPPLLAMLSTWGKSPNTQSHTWSEKQATYYAYKVVSKSFRSGEFLSFYIDPIRGEQAAMNSGLMEKNYDNDEYMGFEFQSPVSVYFRLTHPRNDYESFVKRNPDMFPNPDLWVVEEGEYLLNTGWPKDQIVSFTADWIHDKVDPSYPIEYCVRKSQAEDVMCFNMLDYIKPLPSNDISRVMFPAYSAPPTIGVTCVDSVSYTDIMGRSIRHEFIKVAYDKGIDRYAPGNSILIENCAGDAFRQRY